MTSDHELDLTGLKCPMPIVRLNSFVKQLESGEQFTAYADDQAFCSDVRAWCNSTGHELLDQQESGSRLIAVIRTK